jgi:hypothetical protein
LNLLQWELRNREVRAGEARKAREVKEVRGEDGEEGGGRVCGLGTRNWKLSELRSDCEEGM